MRSLLLSGAASLARASAAWADCPPVTVADPQGVAAGAFLQQYELAEFHELADRTLASVENP